MFYTYITMQMKMFYPNEKVGKPAMVWILGLLLAVICSPPIQAASGNRSMNEEISITGVVSGDNGEPIPGVAIIVKGTAIGTISDGKGAYKITAPANAVLVFSFIGFLSEEVAIEGRDKIDIVLIQDLTTLNDIVSVGYGGTQKKANLTGSVTSVDFTNLENIPQASTANILSGRLPGVAIVQKGGQPGADDSDVFIRGMGTLNDASPLVIIDGAQATIRDLNNLSPQEIGSVSVLKDASSAAIYGARGGNGVILVTTKMPVEDKFTIHFNTYTAIQQATRLPKFVESWQFMELHNEAEKNYTSATIDSAKAGMYSDNIANTKWFDEIFHVAPMTNYNLSISGKNQETSYTLALGYLTQDGIMRETSGKRYNLRSTLRSELNETFTAGLNIWGYVTQNRQAFASPAEIMANASRSPIMPVRYANGDWAVFSPYGKLNTVINPLLSTQTGSNEERELKLNVQPSLQVKLYKDLTLATSLTYSYRNSTQSIFEPFYSYSYQGVSRYTNTNANLSEATQNASQLQWQTTANYTKTLHDVHTISVLLGHEAIAFNQNYFEAKGDFMPSNNVVELDNATKSAQTKGNSTLWRLQSFFGRINYNYKDKYLVDASLRTDGSSRFNGKYRMSPSASLGWVISQEDFMSSLPSTISFAKLRIGYGKLGNDRIGDFNFKQTLSLSEFYNIGGVLRSGAAVTSFGNADVTWEQTTTTNVGLDIGLLDNKIYMSLEAYNRLTDGILYRVPLPASFGTADAPVQNIAAVSNRGVELAIQYQGKKDDFSYSFGANVAYNRNRVEKLNGQRVLSTRGIIEEGSAINAFYGYVADGLYTQKDEDEGYPKFNSTNVKVGSIKFKDLNGDNSIDEKDRTVIGQSATPYIFGLTSTLGYKGFDLNLLVQGVANKDIYINDVGNKPANDGNTNFWAEWYDNRYHAVNNPNGTMPVLKRNSPEVATTSTFWLKDASYVRIKNIEIGYRFTFDWLKRAKIQGLRVYLGGQNLVTFTSLTKNLDPERANFQTSNMSYPQTRVYTVGANVTF